MKKYYIDSDGHETEGTPQYPANTGIYLVIMVDGRTSVEPYTVAFAWNNFPGWEVMLSTYLKPLS
jgi:hypothetical protein